MAMDLAGGKSALHGLPAQGDGDEAGYEKTPSFTHRAEHG
jgi:hypothetical protein